MKIHPGHDVLSLFGMSSGKTLPKKTTSLVVSLFGAFLIVIAVSAVLAVVMPLINAISAGEATTTFEAAAFTPGQSVTTHISAGYVGSYR